MRKPKLCFMQTRVDNLWNEINNLPSKLEFNDAGDSLLQKISLEIGAVAMEKQKETLDNVLQIVENLRELLGRHGEERATPAPTPPPEGESPGASSPVTFSDEPNEKLRNIWSDESECFRKKAMQLHALFLDIQNIFENLKTNFKKVCSCSDAMT